MASCHTSHQGRDATLPLGVSVHTSPLTEVRLALVPDPGSASYEIPNDDAARVSLESLYGFIPCRPLSATAPSRYGPEQLYGSGQIGKYTRL
jgi:hypothetical protein